MSIISTEILISHVIMLILFNHLQAHKAVTNKERCYEGLGCVKLSPEWYHQSHRPINELPADRHAVNTIFVHWILNNGNVTPEIIGTGDLRNSGIRACLKLLIHDFTGNGYTGWVQHIAKALLTNPESVGLNIVSVDWAPGAEPPYVQAVANARLVALEIVSFLHKLKTIFGLQPGRVHVIGHGVGGHIAGYVGKLMRLRRITALDPSGVYFTSMPPNVRLHIDDAEYIEVLHTDTVGQGTGDILGHVDFYANGGKKQPGCKDYNIKVTSTKRGDLKLGQILAGCSHKRSLKYYIETLMNPTCIFLGISCKSYKDFMNGKCLNCGEKMELCTRLYPMGHPQSVNNTYGFHFVTSNAWPFCVEILKITLTLEDTFPEQEYIKGHFSVTIPQSTGDVKFLINENSIIATLRSGTYHTFVVFRAIPPVLGLPAKTVAIKWHHGPLPCSWCTAPTIASFKICKMSDKRDDTSQLFCPVSGSADENRGLDMQPCQDVPDKREKDTNKNETATSDDDDDNNDNYDDNGNDRK